MKFRKKVTQIIITALVRIGPPGSREYPSKFPLAICIKLFTSMSHKSLANNK